MEIEILRIFGKIRSKFNQQCKFIKRLFKVTVLHRKLTSVSLNSKMFCLTKQEWNYIMWLMCIVIEKKQALYFFIHIQQLSKPYKPFSKHLTCL